MGECTLGEVPNHDEITDPLGWDRQSAFPEPPVGRLWMDMLGLGPLTQVHRQSLLITGVTRRLAAPYAFADRPPILSEGVHDDNRRCVTLLSCPTTSSQIRNPSRSTRSCRWKCAISPTMPC